MSERLKLQSLPALGLILALVYGLGGELIFKQSDYGDVIKGTLSISFLFLVPMGIGALVVALSPAQRKSSWPYAIFAPWIACAVLGIVVMLLAMEAWICVAMGLPIFFVMSSLGGIIIKWWHEQHQGRDDNNLLGIVLLAPLLFSPLLFSPIEARWQQPTVIHEVKASVVVNASADAIWNEFVTVPKIQPQEEHFAWFRAAGLPHPVEATLVNAGPKGVRYASYDNGMKVIEPVQVWSLYDRYRFGVNLDRGSGQQTPLWSDVASEHLHVLWVEYQIQPLSDKQVRLDLTSHYALQTPVNPYAALWVDFLLGDFQHYILDIVTARAENKS